MSESSKKEWVNMLLFFLCGVLFFGLIYVASNFSIQDDDILLLGPDEQAYCKDTMGNPKAFAVMKKSNGERFCRVPIW